MKMRQAIYNFLYIGGLFFLSSCQQEYAPLVSLGMDDVYLMPRMKVLSLHSEFVGEDYTWTLEVKDGADSVVSKERDYLFLPKDTGVYYLDFEISDPINPYRHRMKIVVVEEQVAYSPYIARVYEYCPAPGQFVNKLPKYEKGDTEADMVRKAEESIARNSQEMISLGSYGGYVTFGFDHTVINVLGEYDFKIDGNAFVAGGFDDPIRPGGSCEPGIVMVSFDANQNGIPDDEWYELAGSEYYKPETIKNYKITYHQPDLNHVPTPDNDYHYLTDTTYIAWTTNGHGSGYVFKNSFYDHNYWPEWRVREKELQFEGTKLLDNAVDESGNGTNYVQYFYPWGYVDNQPNGVDKGFKIDWAIDKDGNKVHLPGVDFIRVYTALNQYCGWIGETSTEVINARDLHIPIRPNFN